jgi:hypothetical protein
MFYIKQLVALLLVSTLFACHSDNQSMTNAKQMVENLFADLKIGKSEKMAKLIAEEIGYAWDDSTKRESVNAFKSDFDLILRDPPAAKYGKLQGYDLIDESFLPHSNRYFRLVYISYHEGAPLIWEFRFYVKPNGKIALNNIVWSEKNPFEYISTSDMLLK